MLYPGLESHPSHDLANRQMRDYGGMVSFLVESEEEAVALVARTKLFLLAESLGGVESLIEHPARMTHASTADAPFAAPRNLVRLSVGIEAVGDLLADLEAALVRPGARVAPARSEQRPGRDGGPHALEQQEAPLPVAPRRPRAPRRRPR